MVICMLHPDQGQAPDQSDPELDRAKQHPRVLARGVGECFRRRQSRGGRGKKMGPPHPIPAEHNPKVAPGRCSPRDWADSVPREAGWGEKIRGGWEFRPVASTDTPFFVTKL